MTQADAVPPAKNHPLHGCDKDCQRAETIGSRSDDRAHGRNVFSDASCEAIRSKRPRSRRGPMWNPGGWLLVIWWRRKRTLTWLARRSGDGSITRMKCLSFTTLIPTRHLLAIALLAFAPGVLSAQDTATAEQANIVWTDIRELGVEGQGWPDTKAPFDRLPAKAEDKVRAAVWNLSRNSAGMHVRFATDSTTIHARWALTSSQLAMPHMAATGVSGLDLYVKTESGLWRWLAVGIPKSQTNSVALIKNLPPGTREYLLYLPLYNGAQFVDVGVPQSATLTKASPWGKGERKPVVFYGTSILHGACASRPGMVHSAMLGRRFHWPTINLGFSGNGRMEPELADLLAELDPAVYVLDCLPNMTADQVAERVEPFVRKLRETHPRTPIVLVEDRNYADAFLVASKRERNETSQAELQAAFKRLKKTGVKNLHYIPARDLLGHDGDGTVDSSHPNDLGFARQADVFAKVLGPLLKKAALNR